MLASIYLSAWAQSRYDLLPQQTPLAHGTSIVMNPHIRLIDLVPRRPRAYVLGGLAALLMVGGLEALYSLMPLLAPQTTDGRVAAFDLDGEGSLAVWFSTVTLLFAALASTLVYVVHANETRGRRLWLWGAACWLVMSIDECSSVHEAFKELMSHVTGERLIHDGTIWWVMGYFAVLSVIGAQILWRMRVCASAALAWLSVAGFYATAVLAELAWITPKDQRGVMLEEGCEMLGNVALLMSLLLFARHQIMRDEPVARETTRTPSRPEQRWAA